MTQQRTKQLAKFLAYVLGRRPDEFGLIPDPDGYVKLRDLFRVMSEEAGWRHVRQAAINEVIGTVPDPPVEIDGDRIRARDRSEMPVPKVAEDLPKLLYTCVRQKAHPVILEKGVSPLGGLPHVILSSDKEMAGRLGKRFDPEPLFLTVQVAWSVEKGVLFQKFGESLYMARDIPPGAFIAPPLPAEKGPEKKAAPKVPEKPKTPGSFILEFTDPEEKKKFRQEKKKKEKKRDRDNRKVRQQKQDGWSR